MSEQTKTDELKQSYIAGLKASAQEIMDKADEIIGDISHCHGITVTVHIEPDSPVYYTTERKQTVLYIPPRRPKGGD